MPATWLLSTQLHVINMKEKTPTFQRCRKYSVIAKCSTNEELEACFAKIILESEWRQETKQSEEHMH